MKHLQQLSLLFFLFTFLACSHRPEQDAINPSLTLWYDKPASVWSEALPLGNGRLGAMVYGRTASETIQFNEETLWTGQPHDYANKGVHNYLEKLRRLLWEGKQDEAEKLGNQHFMSQPFGQLSYSRAGTQPVNLQGIWNELLAPPWDSKYTININTEMNYWIAEMTNLSELSDPLIQMVSELAVTGKNTAMELLKLLLNGKMAIWFQWMLNLFRETF